MADQAVSSFLNLVCDAAFKRISDLLKYEYGLLEFTDAVQELKKQIVYFRKIAEEHGGKIFERSSTTRDPRDWLFDVNRAVEDAETVVVHAQNLPPVCHSFPTACFTCSSVRERRAVGQRLHSMLQKFATLNAECKTLNFEEINLIIDRESYSTVSEGVVGRDELKEKIIKVLLSEATDQSRGLKVYAVIGQGGIGKTTFAQLIYNDTRVKDKFDLTIWVWVSQTFEVKIVMRKIIEDVSKETPKLENLESIQNRMKEILSGKKFLLVLDDSWNERPNEWDKLKSPLNCGATGSCIILTTRGSNVASVAGAHVPDQFNMPVLSEDECWQVFKQNACFDENQENGVSLEVIGKQIAEKCGGLPLAAKCLGGSLKLTREVYEWELVRDSHIWKQSDDILPALKLSFDRLDGHSKNCFTFCCVFPKGYEMDKEELIQVWMANDLIPSNQGLELEDKGDKIFKDLVVKCFFRDSEDSFNRVFVTMHDLMHDLCLYFRKECFYLEGSDIQIPPQTQHLFVDHSYPFKTNLLETLSKSHSSLHTCIFWEFLYGKKINFKPLYCLRVLKLSNARLEDLPISIGNVKDLKYLDLCFNYHLTHLPNSMGDLIKLQTLKLSGCWNLTELPEGITRLVNLRHFDLSGCRRLTHLPGGIGGLMNLRHLDLGKCESLTHLPDGITGLVKLEHLHLDCCHQSRQLRNGLGQFLNLQALMLDSFMVGRDDGQRITELKRLNGLRGELSINGLENVRDATEATEAMLKEKKKLSSLSLIWGSPQGSDWGSSQGSYSRNDKAHESPQSSDEAEAVLVALQPTESLNKELVIDGYRGSVFPTWMQFLHNVVRIELRDCINCECLPRLGQLVHLEELTITGMRSLKCIGTEFYGSNSSSGRRTIFPSLVSLTIEDMPKLEEWEDVEMKDSQPTEACPCLIEVKIKSCKSLKSLPECLQNLSNLLYLEISNWENLKILPHWLQNITSLQSLEITECHADLELRCAKDTGEYWPFIEHIPDIRIEAGEETPPSSPSARMFFMVGREDGQRITELTLMNGLEGELSIKGLENVRDATEATEVMLKENNYLSSLLLFWGSSQGSYSSSDEAVEYMVEDLQTPQSRDEAVLEALQPPESLNKKLVIHGYGGSVFPRWMQLLHNLVEIKLSDCINCERLPPLGQLLYLEELIITGMRSLKCIDTEFYGSNSSTIFLSLVKLVIADMPKLEEWGDAEMKDSQQTEACPCLQRLMIASCGSLKSLPECVRNLSSLKRLDIRKCDQLKLSSEDFQSLISLGRLELTDLPKLTSFPALQDFSNLDRLRIRGCKNLMNLGPEVMDMVYGVNFVWIWFEDCEQLELSSRDFQLFSELEQMHLAGLPKLTSLPQLQHIHSIYELRIRNCKNLKILPHWLQNITSLQSLEITECHPDLKLRCANDTGEYWPFIKHIPRIDIEAGEEPPSSTPSPMDMDDASTPHLG